ncbi:cytochrome c oxidase assembly protein [Gordonia sp. CPCC 205333]|uniref:cytochrome c oxidase assembly protein n=1 Tax=Gordonia sp. CPCC 205333 TaxID=3140790 RepID=UPI003AF33FFE
MTIEAPVRDAMDSQRGVVGALTWVLGWVGAIVAVAVTAFSASSAIALAGVPDPGPITTYGLPALTALGQLSASIALGSALFGAFFVPPQRDGLLDIGGYRAMKIASMASIIWAVCAVLLIPLSISNVSGQSLPKTLQMHNLITAYGQVADARTWGWTAVLAILTAIAARVTMRWGWVFAVLLLASASLLPVALAGHSSAGGDHDLGTNSLILHIGGAAIWMGGLFAVAAYAFAGGHWRALAVRRFSRVAFWCIIVVGVSGVVNALIRVPIGDLFSDLYGRIILAKVVALVVLGALGAWHRRRTISSLDSDDTDPRRELFVRFALVESLVFAVTFGIAAGLSKTPPPPIDTSQLTPAETVIGYRIDAPPTFGRIVGDWRFDLIFGTAAIVLCVVYLRGVWRLRQRGDAWPVGRTVAWVLGCLCLLFASSSGLGVYGPAMFSIHMIGHMILSMLIPVLLVLGGPVTLALRALPVAGRGNPPGPREWIQSAIHSKFAKFVANPIVAVVLFVGSFYVLYLGGLFAIAVDYHAAHLAMNAHFLISGYVFYWLVIGIDPAPRKLSPIAKLAMVLGTLPFHAFFGVALMMSNNVIAESYYRNLHLPWAYSLFDDQRLGGGIAWAAGEIPLVIVMLSLLVQWSRQDNKQAKRFDRNAERDHDAELDSYNEMFKQLNRKG